MSFRPLNADPSRRRSRAHSCLAASAVLLSAEGALADGFRYIDRTGRVHEVAVRAPPPRDEAPPKEETAQNAQTPEIPAAPANGSPKTSAPEVKGPEFPYAMTIREAARLYSLPVELLRAVMRVESGYDPNAVSPVGARGLMQLMPKTAEDLHVTDAFDPRQNILGGARYLRILINTFDGSVALALAAYHAGASTVERYGGVPPFPDTRKYVALVIEVYHRYKEESAATAANTKTPP